MTKISVVVPVYNVESYLRECVNSISNQTYENIEIILIDDGSTDQSGHICDEFECKDNRIKTVHTKNKGLSAARNKGIDMASGEYVIFIDSDDFWCDNTCLEKLLNVAETYNTDVVRGEYFKVDQDGNCLGNNVISEEKVSYRDCSFSSYEMIKDVVNGEYFSVLFFFKVASLGEVRFNENRKFQEDIDFAIRYFHTERICGYLPLEFYAYRQRQSSITSTPRLVNVKDSFSFCDLYYEYALKTENKELANLYIYYSIMMYQWTLESVATKEYFSRYSEIDRQVNLVKLRRRVRQRIRYVKERKFPIQIYVSPFWGIKLLHLRWKLGKLLKLIKLK